MASPPGTTEESVQKVSGPLFNYQPLAEDEIRVIELFPKDNAFGKFHCRIHHVNISHSVDEASKYAALSYAWGTERRDRQIWIEGQEFLVSPNLEAALLQLRAMKVSKVWIDAISINQDDVEEKNNQVQLMWKIYRGSQQLLIWLGMGNAESGRTVELMDECFRRKEAGEPEPDFDALFEEPAASDRFVQYRETVHALAHFFLRLWFTRSWVVQEYCIRVREDDNQEDITLFICGELAVTDEKLWAFISNEKFWDALMRIRLRAPQEEAKILMDVMGVRHHISGLNHIRTYCAHTRYMWEIRLLLLQELPDMRLELQATQNLFEKGQQLLASSKSYYDSLEALHNHRDHPLAPVEARSTIPSIRHQMDRQAQEQQAILKGQQQLELNMSQMAEHIVEKENELHDVELKMGFTGGQKSWLAKRLVLLLSRIRVTEATDARDKIYSALGLLESICEDSTSGLLFDVDYNMTVEAVYATLVKVVVTETAQLDILRSCSGRGQHINRTWVPDWTVESTSNFFSTGDEVLESNTAGFNASLSSCCIVSFAADLSSLTVRGILWDTIRNTRKNRFDFILYRAKIWRNNEKLAHKIFSCLRTSDGHFDNQDARLSLRRVLLAEPEPPSQRENHYAPNPLDWSSPDLAESLFERNIFNGSIVITMKGLLGRCVGRVKRGDIICVLLGCPVPMVLRPTDTFYEVVGDVYLDGIMYGEAMEALQRKEVELQDFELR